MILKGYIYAYLYVVLIALTSHLLKKLKVKTIIIRKSTHIMISLVWLIMYAFLGTSIHVVLVALTFVIGNILLYKFKLYRIFLSEGDPIGIVYYSVSIFILAIITYFYPNFNLAYGIGILSLGLGDGFAPLVASYLKSRKLINHKTLIGSITVLVMTCLVLILFNNFLGTDYSIVKIIIISAVAMVLELIGNNGLDNVYLPIGLAITAYLLGLI